MDGLAGLREQYTLSELLESTAKPDPFEQFRLWFDEAQALQIREANSMALATANSEGRPDVRTVLLKGVDDGFLFFTNYDSAKARDLEHNPWAALCFHWKEMERQVRIRGSVERTSREEAQQYFHSRPRGSQLGASSSRQSHTVANRQELEDEFAKLERAFAEGDVPLPEFWGGYRLIPDEVEFWQGRRNRLHDRLLYERSNGVWTRRRLGP